MKIGIDVRPMETGHRFRGIGTYAQELLTAISKIDKKNEYLFFTQQKPSRASEVINRDGFHAEDVLIRKVKDPTRYYWYLDQFYLPRAIRNSSVDLIHILDQLSCPYIKAAKAMVTVHDLIQLMPIGNPDLKTKIKFRPIKKSDKIIAISESVKKDLIELMDIPPAKIKVIYNGYDNHIFKPSPDPAELTSFRADLLRGKGEKYLLYVGSFAQHEPRKNLNFLIDVFEKVAKENAKLALVLIGKFGQESDRLKILCRKKGIAGRTIFLDFIPNKNLAPYFQAAEIFLFPSLYEGFGIPPLQALATGTPVISSNTSSLPEVVGQGGLLLDPEKVDDWVKAIKLLSEETEAREKFIREGLKQAQKFSWEKCAREVIETYEELKDEK